MSYILFDIFSSSVISVVSYCLCAVLCITLTLLLKCLCLF